MEAHEVKAAWDARLKVGEDLKVLDGEVEGREDGPTGEDTAKEGALEARYDELSKLIDSGLGDLQKRASIARIHDEQTDRYASLVGDGESRTSEGQSDLEKIRAWADGETRAVEFPFEVRDLSKLSASAGADTVPESFVEELYVSLRENATVLQDGGARVVTTATGEALDFPKVSGFSTGLLEGETDAIAEDDPTFAKVTLNAYKYAVLNQVSHELLADSAVDLQGFLAFNGGSAIGRALGADLITGDGTNKPNGVDECSNNVTAVGTNVITTDELLDVQHTIASPYRDGAVWLMKDATVKLLRKLKDDSNQYLWQPGLTAGSPSTLLGSPVLIDDSVAAPTTGLVPIVYGNLQRGYLVRIAGGVRIDRSDDYAFNTDLVTFRYAIRADGDIIDEDALVKLTLA